MDGRAPIGDDLRTALVRYIGFKFNSRPDVADNAQDIVNEAFLNVIEQPSGNDKLNFGYLSVVCLRIAYKFYKKADTHSKSFTTLSICEAEVGEDDFVEDILNGIDAAYVLASLDTLRDMERIVITERYYGECSFKEIAQKHGINLNTILSHHRRALQRLKPLFTRYFNYDEKPEYDRGNLKEYQGKRRGNHV